jgi:5-methylcytosine-specific restriction endonuclease McrA
VSQPIEVAERVIRILQEGSFTATYKQAVLLALVDLCVEAGATDGRKLYAVPTRALAAKVISLYWPHTVNWTRTVLPDERSVLLQNRSGTADSKRLGGGIIAEIASFRRRMESESKHGGVSFAQAQRDPAFSILEDSVTFTLIEMPLPKLQRIGGRNPEWLYRIGWKDKDEQDPRHAAKPIVTDRLIREFLNKQEHPAHFGTLFLQQGVADAFVRLHPLLRSHIEQHWSAQVVKINKLSDDDVSRFLFDRERQNLRAIRGHLIKLHNKACFYCGGPLESDVEVDHFIPWARLPDDGLHNLVPAHRECNASKSDYFASVVHLERWMQRMKQQSGALREIAAATRWDLNPDRGRGIARSIYNNLPADMLLWERADDFVPLDAAGVAAALSA